LNGDRDHGDQMIDLMFIVAGVVGLNLAGGSATH
jgi:hypothetical protein